MGVAAVVLAFSAVLGGAENAPPKQLVQEVMQNELRADSSDHSHWIYHDQKKTPEKSTVKMVVETANGDVEKTLEIGGRPLTPEERKQDQAKIENLVNDPAAQQKQRENREHDGDQARSLMKMLPDAFIWTEAGQNDGSVTLDFKPNPEFKPPTREARVFAAMAGKMVVNEKEKRLESLSGELTEPVDFGWGLLGRLRKGGTFLIERKEIAPGEWKTTGTHVHIHGRALFFKSIDEQEDEETSDYKPAPSLSLEEAANMLNKGVAAKQEQPGGGK